MNDWTEKDTHDILTQHGYKKPANGPSYLRTYAHPEGHKIEIDRNMYKHTKGNGEVSRGHVTNLPFAMRQLHKPKERMMEVELDIYNSKEKNAADDKMVSPGITDRFKKDVAFNSGDYGNVQTKYAPGVTYEGEYDRGIAKMKAALKSREAEDEFRKKYKEPKQPKKGLLKKIFGEEMDLLKSVIAEAQDFSPTNVKKTKLPLTNCAVCGKNGHVPAKHLGRALGGENNQPIKESSPVEPKVIGHFIQHHLPSGKKHRGAMMDTHLGELGVNGRLPTGEKVTKDTILKHWNAQQPKTYKYEWDKETKEAEGCPDCGKPHDHNAPCAKKSLLFGDEKSVQEGMKFSRQHDTPEKAEAHKESLVKQGVKAWVNHSPDGTHHTFWMQEDEKKAQRSIDEAKKKKWDKIKHVAAIARTTIGPIKKGQVITPKKERKEKYKVDYMKEEGEESKHAYAARKHDEAAEHAGSEGRVIDRPYKDAVRASEQTKHPRINEYIRNTSARWGGDPIPHSGGRKAWHTKLAQMHRDADNE